jgi:hypothetical protein
MFSIVVVRVSSSFSFDSSVWSSCSMTQSSTSAIESMISQDRPNFWSLRTTRSLFWRRLSSAPELASGIDSWTGSCPSQART